MPLKSNNHSSMFSQYYQWTKILVDFYLPHQFLLLRERMQRCFRLQFQHNHLHHWNATEITKYYQNEVLNCWYSMNIVDLLIADVEAWYLLTLTWFSYAFWWLLLKVMKQTGHFNSSTKCSSTCATKFCAFSGVLSNSRWQMGQLKFPLSSSVSRIPMLESSSSSPLVDGTVNSIISYFIPKSFS